MEIQLYNYSLDQTFVYFKYTLIPSPHPHMLVERRVSRTQGHHKGLFFALKGYACLAVFAGGWGGVG